MTLLTVYRSYRYEDAAEDFSKSHLSFEEVALKFLQVDLLTTSHNHYDHVQLLVIVLLLLSCVLYY